MESSGVVLVILCSVLFFCIGLFGHVFFAKEKAKRRQSEFATKIIHRLDKDQHQSDKTSAYQMVRELARLYDLNAKDDVDLVKLAERKLQVMSDILDHGRECNQREVNPQKKINEGVGYSV